MAAERERKPTSYMQLRKGRWRALLDYDEAALARWRVPGLLCVGAVLLVLATCSSLQQEEEVQGAGRRLLSSGASWEQCDYEEANSPAGWIVFHLLMIFVLFVSIAIICDDFFVPSLEAISEKLSLSEDVAGATFMAAGSSAPELFTSVAGVAVQTDVGVGTIVGSAVFNILIIIALTAALAGQVLYLDWRPLIRDSFFYALSICCFIGFAWDGWFMHYEAAILLVLYALYIVLMVFNPNLMSWMGRWRCFCSAAVEPQQEAETGRASSCSAAKKPSLTGGHARRLSLLSHKSDHDVAKHEPETRGDRKSVFTHNKKMSVAHGAQPGTEPAGVEQPAADACSEQHAGEDSDGGFQLFCCCEKLCSCCPVVRIDPPSKDEEATFMNMAKLVLKWIIYVTAFPFICLFSWTIPKCSTPETRKWYMVSFLMSVLWIAMISFGMVTVVSRFGCIVGIDTYTMGLVVIAIGTSVPDAMSSILVARDGYGDMAVSNAIGSNIFDINLGLGLPFVIRIAVDHGKPIALLTGDLEWRDFYDGVMPIIPHAKFGFLLLLILFITLMVFALNKFRLNKVIGFSFVGCYIVILIYAFVQELYCIQYLETYC